MVSSEGDKAIRMAEDAMTYIFSKYDDASCGDWMSFVSALLVNVSKWLAPTVNEDVEKIMDACYTGALVYHEADKQ